MREACLVFSMSISDWLPYPEEAACRCTPSKQRRITRWEHEAVLEAVQRRLDENPSAMRVRRETVEHPFGTIKARMGATHFLIKTLPRGWGENGDARSRL
jgi:hypothetical protein